MTQQTVHRRIRTQVLAFRAVALVVGVSLSLAGGSAFGQFAATNFLTSTADGATAAFATSTAVGTIATASDNNATALGYISTASGASSTAIGRSAMATATASTAIGATAFATAENATALGRNARAAFVNSTAIGRGATTTRDDQMMFGTSANTYTTAGITSAASTAAQSGPIELVTSDANGNLATIDPASLGIASSGDIDRNTEGVAMSMALSRIPTILPVDTTYAVSFGVGTFGGENAIAYGGSAALTENIFLSAGGAAGTGGRTSSGGAAGITFGW